MKMPGRKTQWAFQDKDMRRLLKKKELRAEEKEWRRDELPEDCEFEAVCCVQECLYPDCGCPDLDESS